MVVRKNSWGKLVVLGIILALLLGFGGLIMPGTASAAVSVTITGDGITTPTTWDQAALEAMEQFQGTYSTINTWPTKKFYVARGVRLADLLESAGIKADAQTIIITASDGYKMTFTVQELLNDTRYYYPGLRENDEYAGYIPGSTDGAVEVPDILALANAETDNMAYLSPTTISSAPILMMGQRYVTEQTNNAFVKVVSTIEVSTAIPATWETPVATPGSGTVAAGTQVALSTSDMDGDNIHYTTDGSDPDVDDPMYNWIKKRWWTSRADDLAIINHPITVDQSMTIKTRAIGFGKYDSPIASFDYVVLLLTPPDLTADTTGNILGQAVDITFTEDAAWRAAVTDITLNGTSIAGQYTVTEGNINIAADVFATPGDYTVVVKATGYSDAIVTQPMVAVQLIPPILTADTIDNMVGQAIDITFDDDAAWRTEITDITVNGASIAGQYIITEGNINIAAGVFTTVGDYLLLVESSGYIDAAVNQIMAEAPGIYTAEVLTWTEDPTDTQTITWLMSEPLMAQVQYLAADEFTGDFDSALRIDATGTVFGSSYYRYSVTLSGLTAATQYVYRVGCEGAWSNTLSFTTAANTDEFSFLYMGDVQSGYSEWENMLDSIHQDYPGIEFSLMGGDLTDNGYDEAEWVQFLDAATDYFSEIPLMPTLGNHDGYMYLQFFALPANGPAGLKQEFYSFDYGNAHFVVLNSANNTDESVKQWLQADLQSTTKTWKFAMFHHPAYPAFEDYKTIDESICENWVPILEQYGVDMVFVGHQHEYMRTYPICQGTVQGDPDDYGIVYVMGNAGSKIYSGGSGFPYIAMEQTGSNYQVININGDVLTMTAEMADGELIESYTIDKSLNSPPVLAADQEGNEVGQAIDITFIDDTAWRNAITGVSVSGSVLSAGQYTVTEGNINIIADVFTAPGDYTVVVKATGYSDASVIQTILAVPLLTPPILKADTTDNTVGAEVDIKFKDNSAWRDVITDVRVDGVSIAGNYSIARSIIKIGPGVFTAPGDYTVVVKATGYSDAGVFQPIVAVPLLAPPILTADTTDNTVGAEVDIKFRDDSVWRAAITDITVDGVSIAGKYTTARGVIKINSGVFDSEGDYEITVKATGYEDAAVIQTIVPVPLVPPILTADTSDNTVGQAIDITFSDTVWQAAITGITVNRESITGQYTVTEGNINILGEVFPKAGKYTIVVEADGYNDATLIQVIIRTKV